MPRIRQPIFKRPEGSPTLEFERFKAGKNSKSAVVYMPDDGLLVFEGVNYEITTHIQPDWTVTDLYIYKDIDIYNNNSNKEERIRMIVEYETTTPAEGKNTFQKICYRVVVPDTDQKAKLTNLFQQHGLKMAKASKEMQAAAKRMRTLTESMSSKVDAICPDFDIHRLNYKTGYRFPLIMEEKFESWESHAAEIAGKSTDLSTADPFSRKRK